jgi:hypothetical protein
MAFSLFKPICALIVFATLSVSTLAQNSERKSALSTRKPATSRTKDQERALALIDSILTASSKSSDDWLKLKTQNQIADTLWDYDKPRARRLFEEAFRGADSLEPKVGRGYASSAPDLVDGLKFEMRKEILQTVSKRDAELAEKLAASIPFAKPDRMPDPSKRQLAYDRELVEHNLAVAINIAQTDPQRAARLARDSLNRIISGAFTKLIRSMRTSSPDLADQLFLDAITAVHRKPTYISNKIGILAPYVFPEINDERDNYSDEGINPEMVTRFLDFVYDALMRQAPEWQVNENSPFGTASFDYRTLQQILPHFEKQDPKRAAELRARLDEIVRKIKEAGREDSFDSEGEFWAELFKRNVPELLSKADASKNQEEKDALYSEAAYLLAVRDRDFEKALPLIERISDQKKRANLLSMLRDGATRLSIKNGDTERAYRYAGGMTDLSMQIRMFQEIARKMLDQKKTERAEEVVNETARLIQNLSDESARAEDLLTLAGIASRVSPARGFEVMHSAVEAINHAEFGPHWSGQTIFKETKASDSPRAVRNVHGLEYLDFGGSFPILARADFSKALALAQAIKMNEASLLAQLAVCRGVLTSSDARR